MSKVKAIIENHALQYLRRRPHCSKELERKLTSWSYNKFLKEGRDKKIEYIKEVSEKLSQSDEEFANWFVSNRSEFKPRSLKQLQYELLEKGVSKDIVTSSTQFYDEELALNKISESKLKHHAKDHVEKYLMRLGFPFKLISKVINKEKDDEEK